MTVSISRFYYDFDDECRTGCLSELAFEDIETDQADEFEATLTERNISYLRIDF